MTSSALHRYRSDLNISIGHQGYLRLVEPGGSWRVDVGRSDDVFLYIVLGGTCVFEMEKMQPIVLKPNSIINLMRGKAHRLRATLDGGTLQTWDAFVGHRAKSAERADRMVRLLVGRMPGTMVPEAQLFPTLLHVDPQQKSFWRSVSPIVSALELELTEIPRGLQNDGIIRRLTEVLCIAINRQRIGLHLDRDVDPKKGVRERLAPLIFSIHSKPHRDWTVAEMASQASMSESSFFGNFKRLFGLSPLQYLASVRIEKAKECLVLQRDPLQRIAGLVGYRSYAGFHKTFKKHAGVTPSEYRRKTGLIG